MEHADGKQVLRDLRRDQKLSPGFAFFIHRALENGARPNLKDDNGDNAMILASHHGLVEIVELLLTKRIPVDHRNKNGYTALITAAGAGAGDIIHMLVARGADVNAKTNKGDTALIFAAAQNRHAAVEALLAHGAKIDARGDGAGTALISAAAGGNMRVVRILIDSGADVTLKDDAGESAKDHARRRDRPDILQMLEAREKVLRDIEIEKSCDMRLNAPVPLSPVLQPKRRPPCPKR